MLLSVGWDVALGDDVEMVGIVVVLIVGDGVGVRSTTSSSSSTSNVIRNVGKSVTRTVPVVVGDEVGLGLVGDNVGIAVLDDDDVGGDGEGSVLMVGGTVGTGVEFWFGSVESLFGSPPSSCLCSSSMSEGLTQ